MKMKRVIVPVKTKVNGKIQERRDALKVAVEFNIGEQYKI